MLTRYWHPLAEMEAMRRQFDALFNELSVPVSEATAWAPAIEVKDTGESFTVRVQLPGMDRKDIDIQASQEAVAIAGEYRQESTEEGETLLRSEFQYGKFHRVVRLPVKVQNDQVQAEYNDGILLLTLPKLAAVRNTVVKVNLGHDTTASDSSESVVESNN